MARRQPGISDEFSRAIAEMREKERKERIDAQAESLATETAADLFHGWLLSQGWTEPPVDPEGCGMCEFRAAMVRALQDGQ